LAQKNIYEYDAKKLLASELPKYYPKFNYHNKLFDKIKQEGFKTQREIIKSNGTVINYGRKKIIRKPDDEITVGISRNGDIIFFDGRHRLNIAKILNLKKIPVKILVIHPDFISKLKK